jgi:cadmium resistance transport/sequestration family protein
MMSWWMQAAIAGSTAFIATNVDDIIILMLFFSQTNQSFRRQHIIAGQYLGFIALIIASLPGFFGGLLVPRTWIGLLGLLPIAIGISSLLTKEEDEPEIQTVSHLSTAKLIAIVAPQTYKVAAVTFANGGDNIGIYVPLFASSNLAELAVICLTFLVLIGIWCYVAYRLTRYQAIAKILTEYGKRIVPFVLIGLGIFILLENNTYQLFIKLGENS